MKYQTEEKAMNGLRSIVRYPEGFDENERYPAILFLHGAGTVGDDIEKLKSNVFWRHTENNAIPCVFFAPQCDTGTVWFDNFEKLTAMAKTIAALSFIDPTRIYLIGTSMGGYGAWQLAMSLNKLFAAVIPVCGGGMYWNAARLKSIPVWAFHGELDNVVSCDESRKMVDAINRRGGHAKLTTYPTREHNAWDDTYSNPEVWHWLLSQKRADATADKGETFDGKKFG